MTREDTIIFLFQLFKIINELEQEKKYLGKKVFEQTVKDLSEHKKMIWGIWEKVKKEKELEYKNLKLQINKILNK